MENAEWKDTLVSLLALASRLEGEGQYNLAKLARATADSLGRGAAYERSQALDSQALPGELERVIETLTRMGVDGDLLAAFKAGAAARSAGRLALIDETPHPYVCRTCGKVAVGAAPERCPTCGAWADTFQWFPPVYWLEAFDPPAALQHLRQGTLEIAALLDGLSEAEMTRPAPDGGWSIRSTVQHLHDAQQLLDFRLDLFMKEEHPNLESKAVFEWATREEQKPPTTLEIFAGFKATRARIIARLEALPLADWWRTGSHEEFKEVSIKQQASYFAAHELTHLPQIARLRP